MLEPTLAQPAPWWSQWPAIVQAMSAAAQVVTAIIIVCLTKRLAKATDSYAEQTKDLVKATVTYAALTKVAVDLSTKQYEGDTSPMWHLSIPAVADGMVWLKVFNLSKNSARVTYLLIRAVSEDEQETRKFILDLGMPGLREDQFPVHEYIMNALQPHIVNGEWTGTLEIAVAYQLRDSGVPIASAGFPFKVVVRAERVVSAVPKLPPISVSRQVSNE